MAFEFDIDQPEPVFVGPTDYVVDFTLGYDLDRGERILMSVVLFKDDSGGDPHELAFGIRRQDVFTGTTSNYAFDHETAKSYVPKDKRQLVSLLVLSAVRALVERVRPKIVVMETFESNLPAPAMGKYMAFAITWAYLDIP